jgi:hypothetical protein
MRQSSDIMHATSGRQFATSYHGAPRRSLEPSVIVRTSSAVVLLRANLQCVRTNMPEILHVIGSVGDVSRRHGELGRRGSPFVILAIPGGCL